jgi:hypothetical protein
LEKIMPTLIVIGTCAALVAGFIGYVIARAKIYKALGVIGAALLIISVFLFVALAQSVGWEGLLYIIIFIGGVAPIAVGGVIGAAIGWFSHHRSTQIPS